MSGSINKAILIGNLCADPEIRRTSDGRPICNMRIATSESWRDKNTGERREKAEFHTVVIFSEGLCKLAEQYLRKGSKVYVEGQLQTRKWQDRDGNDRYSTEVVLQSFGGTLVMLDGKSDSQPQRQDNPEAQPGFASEGETYKGGIRQPAQSGTMSDEVPF